MFPAVTIARVVMHAALFVLAAQAQTAVSPPPASATVVFAGDIVPHRDVLASFAAYGSDSLFAPIAPVIRAADLAFANFETPASASRGLTASLVRFNVHADFVQAVAAAGFDGAAIANNHSFDAGIAGVGDTVATLRTAGLRVLGGAIGNEDPLTAQEFPIAGGTLCVFAATRILNFDMTMPVAGQPRVGMARSNPASEAEALLANVRRARARCGAIIVSLHSGYEYQDRPEPIDRVYFHHLAEAGADVVLAHHSHTVQPVELYRTAARSVPIFYSLGNLVSNQGYSADVGAAPDAHGAFPIALDPRLREGLLAVLRFESVAPGGLRLAEFGYVPLWTLNNHPRVASGTAPAIAAALMPRDGGAYPVLQARWRALVQRVGPAYLLADSAVPGATVGYRTSADALAQSRRAPGIATSPAASAPPPGRSQR